MPRTNVVLSICYTIWRWRMTMTSQRGQTGGCARQDTPRKFLSNRRSEGERSGERDPYLHIHRLTRKHHALSQWEHRLVNFRLCFPPASQPASQPVHGSVIQSTWLFVGCTYRKYAQKLHLSAVKSGSSPVPARRQVMPGYSRRLSVP